METVWNLLSYTKLYRSILTRLDGSKQNGSTKVYKVIQKTHVSTFAKMASISDIDMIGMRGLLNTWWSQWEPHRTDWTGSNKVHTHRGSQGHQQYMRVHAWPLTQIQ